MIKNTVASFILVSFLTLLPTNLTVAAEIQKSCAHDLFSITGSIMRIKPADLPVKVLPNNGTSPEYRNIGGCLRPGEILSLQANKDKKHEVELFIKGKPVLITTGGTYNGTYKVPEGAVVTALESAIAFLEGIKELPSAIGIPPRKPIPTNIPRGDSANSKDQTPVPRQPLRNIHILRNLPKQEIASTAAIVLSWRNGESPWKCEGQDQDETTVIKSQSVSTGWCEITINGQSPVQLSVKDARGDTISWNAAIVSPDVVPRPDWIKQTDKPLSSADRAAWAIWVWRTAGPRWRLQALSMLHEISEDSWLAAYLLNSILDDDPIINVGEALTQ